MATAKTTKLKAEPKVEKVEKEKKVKDVSEVEAVETVESEMPESQATSSRYFEGIGRRKTSHARVRIYTKGTGITINGKPCETYFPTKTLQRIVDAPLIKMKSVEKMRVTVIVQGGGSHSQAEAIRHGVSRALVLFNVDFRKRLKRAGYLTRDSRMKETRKYGLKKARKAPRWSKR